MRHRFSSRILLLLLILFSFFQITFATQNALNITINEYARETVIFNPLVTGSGLYFDANENLTSYSIFGNITIENINPTDTIYNIVLNITNTQNIVNLTSNSSILGYVTITGSSARLQVPDLAAGSRTSFTYSIDPTLIAPPLNFTTNYSGSRTFSGLSIDISDRIQNTLNGSQYSSTCIYNINSTQVIMPVNISNIFYNGSFVSGSQSGSDSSNVTITNQNYTLNWNVLGGNCLFNGTQADIMYTYNSPANVPTSGNYQIINSTTTYLFNDTFSQISLLSAEAIVDLDLQFAKYLNNTLVGDNGTWRINSTIYETSQIDVNVTSVSLWVSRRNATGTGFTNPSQLDNDTVSGSVLRQFYFPNFILNTTTGPWNNTGSEWYFNYTVSSTPIVWMDVNSTIILQNQIFNSTLSFGENNIYIKELYIATGYYLQITKNITRLSENNYSVFIEVINLGSSTTPANQVVQIYNFLPNTFNLTSPFIFSDPAWYNTSSANTTLNDPIYNGTMFQFGIIPDVNPFNASLDAFGGTQNENNTWNVTFNVTGFGEFNYEDLFLTGVDPLHVDEFGATQAVLTTSNYDKPSQLTEYVLGISAFVLAALVILV